MFVNVLEDSLNFYHQFIFNFYLNVIDVISFSNLFLLIYLHLLQTFMSFVLNFSYVCNIFAMLVNLLKRAPWKIGVFQYFDYNLNKVFTYLLTHE